MFNHTKHLNRTCILYLTCTTGNSRFSPELFRWSWTGRADLPPYTAFLTERMTCYLHRTKSSPHKQVKDYHNLLLLHTYKQHGYTDLSSIVYDVADHTAYTSCPDPINTPRSLLYYVQSQQALKQNMHTVSHLYNGKQLNQSRVVQMALDGKSRSPAVHCLSYRDV